MAECRKCGKDEAELYRQYGDEREVLFPVDDSDPEVGYQGTVLICLECVPQEATTR